MIHTTVNGLVLECYRQVIHHLETAKLDCPTVHPGFIHSPGKQHTHAHLIT